MVITSYNNSLITRKSFLRIFFHFQFHFLYQLLRIAMQLICRIHFITDTSSFNFFHLPVMECNATRLFVCDPFPLVNGICKNKIASAFRNSHFNCENLEYSIVLLIWQKSRKSDFCHYPCDVMEMRMFDEERKQVSLRPVI